MGGDDLGSDDDYLAAPVQAPPDDSSSDEEEAISTTKNDKGRELTEGGEDKEAPPPKKKRKRDELRNLGLDIRVASTETQARLLTEFVGTKFYPKQLAASENADDPSLMKRIQGIISKKRLKKWNEKSSPCVLIVCLSARRAVQILKELGPFNIRAVKLFAKHMTIEQQKDQLETGSFGFAVGTPHRILTLAQQGALSFEHTQLVVLDTFLNQKNYSAYTLPDTAPHTQELLSKFVEPECKLRRTLRVAFV